MAQINLKSDTVTKPTPEMLKAMMEAEVGDDVFGDDPTVNFLQDKAAKLFGKEASLFCPTGTMANQIAIQLHTNRLDEIICDKTSHIVHYEVGTFANLSGVCTRTVDGKEGKLTPELIKQNIRTYSDSSPITALVIIENSCNIAGGNYYTLDEVRAISETCKQANLKFHVDGARIFNVLVETKESPQDYGPLCDSISFCLSKGLGAPVGSLLVGSKEFIFKARRIRKSMGGGMRQVGYLAAAGIYALDNHIDRLAIDNQRARIIGETLSGLNYVSNVLPIRTNIVIFDVNPPWTGASFLAALEKHNIKVTIFGSPITIRLVTHLDFTAEMLDTLLQVLTSLQQ